MRSSLIPTLLSCLGVAALVAVPRGDAAACGGFFCAQIPVDQQGEQILFGLGDDGTVTAHIAIAYTGAAPDFSWVVPVPAVPELGVGSQSVFTTLQGFTQPRFNVNWDWEQLNECGGGCMLAFDADSGGLPEASGGDGDVTVLLQQEVGPYDARVIESSDPGALLEWLDDNGFDQPEESVGLIAHYVEAGMVFLALKLQQEAETGDIQPITLTFEGDEACVPLVLTRIAAMPDMPVLVYVAAASRVVPTNWLHVELNPRKIDWLGNGSNYQDVLTQAVNEASGRAFVTEMAQDSKFLDGAFYRQGQYDLDALDGITDPSDLIDALLRGGFPRDATMQALLRKYIPMPQSLVDEGLDERTFYNNIGAYEEQLGGDFAVDSDAFVAELDAKIVQPLKDAQALVDAHAYFTRLYTTVSPDEMTRDPIFAQNPDMGDVSNIHTAEGSISCADASSGSEVTLEFEDGSSCTLTLPAGDNTEVWCAGLWGGEGAVEMPLCADAATQPAAAAITLMQPTGPPVVVTPDEVAEVDRQLGYVAPSSGEVGNPGTIGEQDPNQLPDTGSSIDGPDAGDGGCGAGQSASMLAIVAAAVLLLVARRRRNRPLT